MPRTVRRIRRGPKPGVNAMASQAKVVSVAGEGTQMV